MTSTDSPSQQDVIQRWIAGLEIDAKMAVESARMKLDEAEREIAHIRQQLDAAANDQPYYRIGSVGNGHAQAVFAAFSAIEQLATVRKVAEKQAEEGSR